MDYPGPMPDWKDERDMAIMEGRIEMATCENCGEEGGSIMTLLEFWNKNDNCDKIDELFCASTGSPGGVTYTKNLEDEGEDYCDIHDLIDTGFGINEMNESELWDLNGEVTQEGWEWDGAGSPTDCAGNSITLLRVSF